MDAHILALLLEPAAWLGGVFGVAASLWVVWRFRGSEQNSRNWFLGNWRMRQVLGISALFYLALAASSLILHDRWGWFYVLVALRLGIWWWKRLMNEDVTFPRLLRSRSRV